MISAITEGVRISVSTNFRADLSQIEHSSYFFNYTISIENYNSFTVQLLSREWYIFDSLGKTTIVQGEGVIGEQPVLSAGEDFTYTSGSEIRSELGYMEGVYIFKNMASEQTFSVKIPTFQLIFPPRLN
jgi:ApaG protein